jgi:alkylhydroperoxidase family enzyme
VTLDESLVAQLREDYRRAPITDAERAMLDFCVLITEDATRSTPDEIEGLRRHGFDDRAILQLTLIASWFNYVNRVADALGVGRDDIDGCLHDLPPEAAWAGVSPSR